LHCNNSLYFVYFVCFMTYSTSYCHSDKLWIHGMYVCLCVLYMYIHTCVCVCTYLCIGSLFLEEGQSSLFWTLRRWICSFNMLSSPATLQSWWHYAFLTFCSSVNELSVLLGCDAAPHPVSWYNNYGIVIRMVDCVVAVARKMPQPLSVRFIVMVHVRGRVYSSDPHSIEH
jgi:hypothetical protein